MAKFRLSKKIVMLGKHLNRWIALLGLAAMVAISLACSSGGDFLAGSQSPSTDVFNDPLPASFDDQFKPVIGGELVVRSSYKANNDGEYIDIDGVTTKNVSDDALAKLTYYDDYDADADTSTFSATRIAFGNEELNDGEDDQFIIDSFLMMKTEVTVEMFVDFLNSIAFKQDELTNAGEGETTSFTDPENIYKPVMQSESSCGIYRFEFGVRANDEIVDFSGFYVAGKPTADGYIDPYEQIQTQKPRYASENQSSSFEVAPGRDKYPMVYVRQTEAKEFCRWLGSQYRLPTWQEWAWAARGGSDHQFASPDGSLFNNGSYLVNFQYDRAAPDPARKVGTTGGSNAYGLFDLSGNVYEWTYFKAEDQSEGANVPYDSFKFYMGGSFKTVDPAYLSSWMRSLAQDTVWADDLGFRVIFDSTRGNSIADVE